MMIFRDRETAGKMLAGRLADYQGEKDAIVLGIPRGGVVVAAAVAKVLNLPLDIVVARKLPAPGNPELAIGAVDGEGHVFLREGVVELYRMTPEYLETVIREQGLEANRREGVYRATRPPLNLAGKTGIIVDDGLATGATALAAVTAVRGAGAERVVLAVPVAVPEAATLLKTEVDDLVALDMPLDFLAVGQFYESFKQVTDEEVIRLLKEIK
ncbi:MAG: phosphoribosyltransferase family protein [Patescibacteria group bacterium]